MFTDVAATVIFVLEELDEKFGVTTERIGNESQVRGDRLDVLSKGSIEVSEQPRPTEASAANDDTIAPRFVDHPFGILATPDIAISKDGNIGDFRLQRSNGIPVRVSRIVLSRCASVQTYRRNSDIGRDTCRL